MRTGSLTIVEDYIAAALRNAVAFVDDDDLVVAYLAAEPAVRVHGDSLESCRAALIQEIEGWVRKWLANGNSLPVLDGIDLNAADSRLLDRYHRYSADPQAGLDTAFPGERAFLASLPSKHAHAQISI